jgi:hypothetical protein
MAKDRYPSRASQVSLTLHDTMLQAALSRKLSVPYCIAIAKPTVGIIVIMMTLQAHNCNMSPSSTDILSYFKLASNLHVQ